MNMTSRLTSARGETRVDNGLRGHWSNKGLRGHWSNTPSHLSLILAGDFWSRSLEVDVSHAPVMVRGEVFGEVIGVIFSSLLKVEAKLVLLDVALHPVEAHVK